MTTQPTFFLPHGGGPCFFMEDPEGIWRRLEDFLAHVIADLPERPKALLIVSGHWEAPRFTVNDAAQPPLLYDYYGFPEHTYRLRWDAPGAPAVAHRAASLLERAGMASAREGERGWDHGVFVPMKVAVPGEDIPTAQLSLLAGLDPAAHIAAGRALAPLRDEGVLIIGSGFTTHNLREARFGDTSGSAPEWGREFDDWARETVEGGDVDAVLDFENSAPAAHRAHPRTEHFAPLFVSLGATADVGVNASSIIDGFWYGLAKRSFQFS